MAWCGCSRKGRQCLASSGGGAAGWSVSTSTPYIPWQRRSNKALQPFSGSVSGWVFCAKNWQLDTATELSATLTPTDAKFKKATGPTQNLDHLRLPSPAFSFTLPATDNLYQSFGIDVS